ncbi:MAG: hypothetical protein IKR25_12200 [Muribaculaceae bacterium]|nr:hypothetical protein [Muribaculaceae bacterium]
MRHLLLNILAMLVMVWALMGCTEVSQRGERAGQALLQAWGDTAAMRRVDSAYQTMADSLQIPGTARQMANAFLRTVGDRDSVLAMAQAIAYDAEDFAHEQGQPLVDALLDGSMDARQATDRLFTLHWAADLLGKTDHIARLDAAIDDAANRLSPERQMLLFSRAATPTALGKQMRIEREQPGADTTDLDRRAAMLKQYYNEQQLVEFQNEYKIP